MNNHIKLFAILGVGVSFGLALLGLARLFPFFTGVSGISSYKSAGNYIMAKSFNDCVRMRGSVTRESYPPVCVTKEGNEFTKDVPPIKWPTQPTSDQQMMEAEKERMAKEGESAPIETDLDTEQ